MRWRFQSAFSEHLFINNIFRREEYSYQWKIKYITGALFFPFKLYFLYFSALKCVQSPVILNNYTTGKLRRKNCICDIVSYSRSVLFPNSVGAVPTECIRWGGHCTHLRECNGSKADTDSPMMPKVRSKPTDLVLWPGLPSKSRCIPSRRASAGTWNLAYELWGSDDVNKAPGSHPSFQTPSSPPISWDPSYQYRTLNSACAPHSVPKANL